MKGEIDLNTKHLNLVRNILAAHLSSTDRVWLFGSRATGNTKKFSDIDLLIDTGHPISLSLLAKLTTAFDESMLPYKVDIADLNAISDAFKSNIQSQLIPLPLS